MNSRNPAYARASRAVALALALLMAPLGVALAEGDPAAGRDKSETCIGCHGISGYKNVYPNYRVPRLAGQHREYLVAALKAYQSGDRKHPTMNGQAVSLSDQDIEDIAAYIAGAGD